MTRDSMEKMRLDRRLSTRHGWWKQGELEQQLAELPDSAAKATTLGAAEDDAKPESAESEPTF
jgi:hypothetical protein